MAKDPMPRGKHGKIIKFAPEVLEAMKADYLGGVPLIAMGIKYGHDKDTIIDRLGSLYKPIARRYRFMGNPRKEIKGKLYKNYSQTVTIRDLRGNILEKKVVPIKVSKWSL